MPSVPTSIPDVTATTGRGYAAWPVGASSAADPPLIRQAGVEGRDAEALDAPAAGADGGDVIGRSPGYPTQVALRIVNHSMGVRGWKCSARGG